MKAFKELQRTIRMVLPKAQVKYIEPFLPNYVLSDEEANAAAQIKKFFLLKSTPKVDNLFSVCKELVLL